MNEINSPLTITLGDTPQNKVLSFLFSHHDFDYSKSDLAKMTNLSRQTIYTALKPLLRFDLVIVTRRIANTTLYTLNMNSKPIKALLSYNKAIIKDEHRFDNDKKKIRKILEKRKDMLIALS